MKTLLAILSILFFAAGAEKACASWIIIQQNFYTQDIAMVSAFPPANQQATTPPQFVSIRFTAAVNPQASTIAVYDQYNNKLATGALMTNGTDMSVTMPEPANGYSGAYRVEWTAVCQCNTPKPISGSYYFSVL